MNRPERYELFIVPEGLKKVTYIKDTKLQNTATFSIQREDHTLGNVVRSQLLRDHEVWFAGYKMPHPLENYVIVRVQTSHNSSPMTAMQSALDDLDEELDNLRREFEAKLATKASEYM
eukprot:TRINITY_DN6539_c0_g1_i1.p1 TRINITY_DN6539_c0_g1~~TRINITY_DN6539_c0_g1_i1.p1  ORF type:complete len:118 (+),score=20.69 TRINITY_DN6539_c0_g1_i1:100-453(+)